jgi:HD superfamily phosphodiesterase
MRKKKIVGEIKKLVEDACKATTNYSGYRAWPHHILVVVKYSKLLAKKFGADIEIVEIAALLHDYASIKDYKRYYEDHHIHGARLAGNILKEFNYPKEKIKKVKECILCHRGSKPRQKLSKEARCIADADAMSHFNGIGSLFSLAFKSHKMNEDEATDWIAKKLERSWKKLSPAAKEIIKDKYEASKLLLQKP